MTPPFPVNQWVRGRPKYTAPELEGKVIKVNSTKTTIWWESSHYGKLTYSHSEARRFRAIQAPYTGKSKDSK